MAQMTVDGQGGPTGTTLTLYGPDGEVTKAFAASGTLASAEAMRTILFATDEAAATLGFPIPDFDLGPGGFLDPAGGAACLAGAYPPDCASWGSFPAAAAQGLPDPQSLNAAAIVGAALARSSERDCATWLGPDDDRGIGSVDFYDGVPPGPGFTEPAPPAVAGNSEAVALVPCPAQTAFNLVPANPTNDTTPFFAYDLVQREYGSTFRCSFQSAPFSACPAAGAGYGPLADGTYRFEVEGSGHAGPDPTPLSWEWAVDTVPPETFIDATPPEPSGGFSATFAFHSSEHNPTFRCQLDEGFVQACEPGRTYFLLEDGSHAFRVWSSDQATNMDPSPAVHVFGVDTRLGDRTPPNAKITSAPENPSPAATSRFTYTANEPGSGFQCRLDERAWASCPATGVAYGPRRNGRHSFEVRAIDRAGNVDPVPDAHAWVIRAPTPQTLLTRVPAGVSYLRGREREASVSFALRSDVRGASFRCRIDKRPFKRCAAKLRLKANAGRHRIEAYAVDAVGNADPTPVRWIFRVAHRGERGAF